MLTRFQIHMKRVKSIVMVPQKRYMRGFTWFMLMVPRWSGLQFGCCYTGEACQRGEAGVSCSDIFYRVRGQS